MPSVPVSVHRVLPAAKKLTPVPLDELSLVESQLHRPRHRINRPFAFQVPIERSANPEESIDAKRRSAGNP
jgi:hypothetical protein